MRTDFIVAGVVAVVVLSLLVVIAMAGWIPGV